MRLLRFACGVGLLFILVVCPARPQISPTDLWTAELVNSYRVTPNVTYGIANNVELKLDLYLPRSATGPVPTVMCIHGGGWVAGNKDSYSLLLMPYLAKGWAAVNVEYRLASSSLAPAAVEDCRRALRWLWVHAKQYNLDTTKIIVTGHSAGGHLALITGLLPPISEFDRTPEWAQELIPLHVAAIINWFGITDVTDLLDGPNMQPYAVSWLGTLSNREDLARRVSPINYVGPSSPPTLSIHGTKDPLVPYTHATRLHEALTKAGVPNKLITIPGGGHGGFSNKDLDMIYRAIDAFLNENVIQPDEPSKR